MKRRARLVGLAVALVLVVGALLYLLLRMPHSAGEGRNAEDTASERPLVHEPARLEGRSRPVSDGSHPPSVGQPDKDVTLLRFIDASNGSPVEGVRAWSARSSDTFVRAPRLLVSSTDESGMEVPNTALREMAASSELLLVRAWGYLPRLLHPTKDVLAAAGVRTVPLSPGQVVSGRVLDPCGQPVPGAEVHAMGRHGWTLRALQTSEAAIVPGPRAVGDFQIAVTDAQGNFSLRGLGGFPVELRASRVGYTEIGPIQRVEYPCADVELVLRPVRRAGIHVEDALTGEAITTYSVSVGHLDGMQGFLLDPCSRPADAPYTGWHSWTGDTWFTWMLNERGMSTSRVPCTIGSAGYASQDLTLELHPPDHLQPQVVRLWPDANLRIGTVQVTVEFRGVEVNVPCCHVRLTDKTGRFQNFSLVLDDRGVSTFRAPVGTYKATLFVSAAVFTIPGLLLPDRELDVTEDAVTQVTWEPQAGIVDVSAVLSTGEPLPGFTFDVWHGKRHVSFKTEWLLARGEECAAYKRVNKLPPGTARMVLPPGEYRFLLQPVRDVHHIPWVYVTVEAGSSQKLELVADPTVQDPQEEAESD